MEDYLDKIIAINGFLLLISGVLFFKVVNYMIEKTGKKNPFVNHWLLKVAPWGLILGSLVIFTKESVTELVFWLAFFPLSISYLCVAIWVYLFHTKKQT